MLVLLSVCQAFLRYSACYDLYYYLVRSLFTFALTLDPGYMQYINKIRDIFNANSTQLPVFVACGPIESGLSCLDIMSLAETIPNVYYMDMQNILSPNNTGCLGHPDISGHAKMAKIALAKIQGVLNW